jgi:cobaltochelatase CobS
MAANKAFKANFTGVCSRCKGEIKGEDKFDRALAHWILKFNLPRPNGSYQHYNCSNPITPPHEISANPDVEENDTPTPQPTPSNGQPKTIDEAIQDLIKTYVPKTEIDIEKLRDQIVGIAKEEVSKIIVPQNVTLKIENREIRLEGITPHKGFMDILWLATQRVNVYLYGDPGWGKSRAIYEVAKALELPYRFMTLTFQTSDSRVTGYRDGNGCYWPSGFRELYVNGGVWSFDEADLANGNTISAMNNPLANGIGEFPDGRFDRHGNFICFANGNTSGEGGNPKFPDSRPLNQAFRDRFFFYEWGEDKAFERTIALKIHSNVGSWVDWIQKVRAYVASNNIPIVVSPRATYQIATLKASGCPLSTDRLLDGVLFKGKKQTTVKQIMDANPLP